MYQQDHEQRIETSERLNANILSLNMNKTYNMLFSYVNKTHPSSHIKIDQQPIMCATKTKFLGVIDHRLN